MCDAVRDVYKYLVSFSAILLMAGMFQNCSTGFEAENELASDTKEQAIEISLDGVPDILNKSSFQADFEVLGLSQGSVSCQLIGGAEKDCSSKVMAYSGLSDGDYTIEVTATSSSGKSVSKRKNIRIDATAPVLTVTTAPLASTTHTSASFVFVVSDNLSGVAAVRCSLDSGAFYDCTSPVSLTNLSLAAHNFRIQATDVAGNLSSVYTHTWTVQDPAPTVSSVAITTTLPSITKSTSVSIAFAGVNVTGYRCRLDNATAAVCTSPQVYSGLSSGSHTFSVQGVRADNSLTAAATASFIVDTIAPTTPIITASEPAATTATSTAFNFSSTDNVGVSSFQCSLNNSTYTNCTSPKSYSNLAASNHVFSVRAVDQATNVSAVATHAWEITSTTIPQPTGVPSVTGVSGNITHGATLSVTGSGFGAKAKATPFFWDDFEASTVGVSALQAGYDNLGTDGKGLPYIRDDRAFSGSKSMRMDYVAGANSMFPRIGKSGLGSTEAYVSLNAYWTRTAGTGGSPFIFKWVRGGANPPYSGNPKFYETIRPGDDGIIRGADRGVVRGDGSALYAQTTNAGQNRDGWHRSEYYYKLSTPGVADGVYQTAVDMIINANLQNVITRESGSTALIDYIMSPFDGNDSYGLNNAYQLWVDDFYIDTTRARVELGDASTLSACKKRQIQIPTAWSANIISVRANTAGFVAGQKVYLYVFDSSGKANANGYELTVGGVIISPTPTPEPTPTPTGGFYFKDNFEGYADSAKLAGGMHATNPGITWRDSTSVLVKAGVDYEGKSSGKSLQFLYKGSTDPNKDAWAEQRVDLAGQYPELWISFDLLVPANYQNRGAGSDGGSNNKVMIVYNDFTANTTMVDFENMPYSNGSGCYLNAQYKINGVNRGFAGTYDSPIKDTYNLFGRNYGFIDKSLDAGKWLHLVFHVKLATSSTAADGVTQVWKNGQKILENVNVPNFNTNGNHFSGMYLMGWANTGYNEDTYFYLDNYTISDQPLQ